MSGDIGPVPHSYADHPASLVLADHQLRPHVWAHHGAGVQVVCRCNDWSGWDYDHPAHLTETLDRAGLLFPADVTAADGP